MSNLFRNISEGMGIGAALGGAAEVVIGAVAGTAGFVVGGPLGAVAFATTAVAATAPETMSAGVAAGTLLGGAAGVGKTIYEEKH
ncbi:MAG: hypothetical protein MJ119_04530 [Lachnospiraceae bacterium]|nr:hypothetical protein [Lachnospiraceae bacterium]